MEIKCPNCGAGITDDSKFCKYCGMKLPDEIEQKRIEINDIAQLEMAKLERERFELMKAEKEKRRKVKLAKRILMVTIWVALVAGYYLLNMSDIIRVYYVIIGILAILLSFGLA